MGGVLPKKEAVGDYLNAFKRVWSWTRTSLRPKSKPKDPLEQIGDYIAAHERLLVDASKKPCLSDAEFKVNPGIRVKTAGRRELAMSAARFDQVFKFSRAIKAQLRTQGTLAEKARNTVKRTVRRDKNGEVVGPERVVAICLDAM